MLVRAEVIQKVGNKYRVRVPSFETGDSNSIWETEAMLCYQPGNMCEYRTGDLVWCDREGLNKNKLVIMGKMYTGAEETVPANKSLSESMVVAGDAEINGNLYLSGVNINTLITKINHLEALLNTVETDVKNELTVIKKNYEKS